MEWKRRWSAGVRQEESRGQKIGIFLYFRDLTQGVSPGYVVPNPQTSPKNLSSHSGAS